MNPKLESSVLAQHTPVIALNSHVVKNALALGEESLDRSYARLADKFERLIDSTINEYRSLDTRSKAMSPRVCELAQTVVESADSIGAARVSQVAREIQRTFQVNELEFALHELPNLTNALEASLDLFLTYASPYGVSRRAA